MKRKFVIRRDLPRFGEKVGWSSFELYRKTSIYLSKAFWDPIGGTKHLPVSLKAYSNAGKRICGWHQLWPSALTHIHQHWCKNQMNNRRKEAKNQCSTLIRLKMELQLNQRNETKTKSWRRRRSKPKKKIWISSSAVLSFKNWWGNLVLVDKVSVGQTSRSQTRSFSGHHAGSSTWIHTYISTCQCSHAEFGKWESWMA